MVHYFIKAIDQKSTKYVIGKQVSGKPNTFLKQTYVNRATAQKHATSKNKSQVGRGKKPSKMKKPQYESL